MSFYPRALQCESFLVLQHLRCAHAVVMVSCLPSSVCIGPETNQVFRLIFLSNRQPG